MRRRTTWGALVLLAGCDAAFDVTKVTQGPPDAPDAPIDTPPDADPCDPSAVVSGSIHFTGTMRDSNSTNPLPGLSIDLIPGGVAPTDTSGAFAIDSPPTNTPLFARFTASGLSSYPFHGIYYQRPFTSSPSDVSSSLFDDPTISSLYAGAGLMRDTSHATALVSVRDCMGNGVANATVKIPGATVVYYGGNAFTDGFGVAYALAIQPGDVLIDSSVAAQYTATAAPNEMLIVYLIVPNPP